MEQLISFVPPSVLQFIVKLRNWKPADILEALKRLPIGWKLVVASSILWTLFRLRRIMKKKAVRGQVVLITGGASGIGRLMALRFGALGAKIVIWDINQAGLDKVAAELKGKGVEVRTYPVDLSNRQAIYQAADQVKKDIGMVHILVNNAGIVTGKKLLEISDEAAERTMAVNTMAHFWTVKAFLPAMLEANNGHIVTIASLAGICGVTGLADYCASKFGAVGFDESLRVELRSLGKDGVHTTCICPYYINTGMFDGVKTRIPFLMPILNEHWAAKQIVNATLQNDEFLMLPRVARLMFIIRLLPVPLQDFLLNMMGMHDSMNEFKGRGVAKAN